MKALFIPDLEVGEVELERYDENGNLRPSPVYKFTYADGSVMYCINWNCFQFIVE